MDDQNEVQAERVPGPDVSTIADRSTWAADPGDATKLTHPGIPGWALDVSNPRHVRIFGLDDGIPDQLLMAAKDFDHAVALIAFVHGQ